MEKSPIQYITKLGIPVDSHVSTGSYVSDKMSGDVKEAYDKFIFALVDRTPEHYPLAKQHHLTFAYLCQNMVRQFLVDGVADVDQCYEDAIGNVDKLYAEHPYHFMESGGGNAEPMIVNGVNRTRGWKSEQACQYLRDNPLCDDVQFKKYCIDVLGMGKAGAYTYWGATYKKVHKCKPPVSKGSKKKSKAKAA